MSSGGSVKPWWNVPSGGTLRAAPALFITTAVVLYDIRFLFVLLIGAPLLPVLLSAWSKRPRWFWRGLTALAVFSAVRLPHYVFTPFPRVVDIAVYGPIEEYPPSQSWLSLLLTPLRSQVEYALVAEAPLLVLAMITVLHTVLSRRVPEKM